MPIGSVSSNIPARAKHSRFTSVVLKLMKLSMNSCGVMRPQ
jgi:hypothetical protein